MSKTAFMTVITAVLTVLTAAGYVDLYRDAGFKHKLARVESVVIDACYRFTCKYVDNAITSAKWHGLPGSATITFYTGRNCDGTAKDWPIDTQSKKDKHFPENFRLDGVNDDISFKVLNAGGGAGVMNVCYLPETGDTTNATANEGNISSFREMTNVLPA